MEKKNSMALFVDEDEEYEFLEISEEEEVGLSLSHWEFISPSDFDSGEEEEPKEEKAEPEDPQDEDIKSQIEPQVLHFQDDHHDRHHGHHDDHHHHSDDDEYDDDDDAYGLDDELVPWSVSGKFGRQRMRKLGKRGFPKMYNSKRSPYLFVRPGVVRGKHGLGLKHSF